MFSILQEHRPELPLQGAPIPCSVWHIIDACWSHEPHERPDIKQVLDNLLEVRIYRVFRLPLSNDRLTA